MNKWINCSDELPAYDLTVLLYKDGSYNVVQRSSYYADGRWLSLIDSRAYKIDPSDYWMGIPVLPYDKKFNMNQLVCWHPSY